jgi:hypothetical protein
MTAAQCMAHDWLIESSMVLSALRADRKSLEKTQEKIRSIQVLVESAIEDQVGRLDSSAKLIRQSEVVIEALRSENKIQGDVEIPMLTLSHQLQIERYKALCAIEVMRQTVAGVGNKEES